MVPAAIEMMDALAIEAAEAAVGCGYPRAPGAVLMVELDGPASPRCEHAVAEVERICRRERRVRAAHRPSDAGRARGDLEGP